MNHLPVSIVVVSRGRSKTLKRCLTGISQVQYQPFEVVVVADRDGVRTAEAMPFSQNLKIVSFDQPNISRARNLGVEAAAGEVVAFIDDDAVPEPQWLRYLVAPAHQSDVAAMGGYVRGRNGISYQWKARRLSRKGEAHDLNLTSDKATVLRPPAGMAIKTEGTNMAFRREVLVELGGFDTAFHYFLDETDLNMRLAQAGHRTAIVPLAEVHHGYEANAMRTSARVPRDLYDIGASWAVFQRKHVAEADRAKQWDRLRAQERMRLLRYLTNGGLEPRGVRWLLKRLDSGYAAGQRRQIEQTSLARHPKEPFLPFPAKVRESQLLASRPTRRRQDLQDAAERVRGDKIATVLSLSITSNYHRVYFDDAGVWVQRGGLYGRSDRDTPIMRMTTRSRRIEKERRRVARQRGFSKD